METANMEVLRPPSYSPSVLEDLEQCPCFGRRPDQKNDTTAKDEGVLLHAAVQFSDKTRLETTEQELLYDKAVLYRDSLTESFGPGRLCYREHELEIPFTRGKGIIDQLIVSDSENPQQADVVDYKFGRKEITPADRNLQGLCYALAVFRKWPSLERVRVHLVAPRLDHVSDHTYYRNDIPTMERRMSGVLVRVFNPFKQPCGDNADLCGRCAHVMQCPAVSKTLTEVTSCMGLPMPVRLADMSNGIDIPSDERMKAQLLAQALENLAERIKRSNTEYVKAGGTIPGYSLRGRPGNIRVVDDTAARVALSHLEMTPGEIEKASSLSFAKATAIYAEKKSLEKRDARGILVAAMGAAVTEEQPAAWLQRSAKLDVSQMGAGLTNLLQSGKDKDGQT